MSSANTINEFITELTRLKNKYISEGKFAEVSDIEKRIHEIMSVEYSYIIQGYRYSTYPIVKSYEDKPTLKLEPHKNSDFYIHAYVNTKACWDCPICEERLIQHISVTVNSQTTIPLHIESLVQELAKRAKDHLERHATGEIGDGDNNSSSNDEQEVSRENNGAT